MIVNNISNGLSVCSGARTAAVDMVGDFGQLISNPVCYICTKNKKTRLSKPFWNNMIKLPSTGARIGTNDNATIEFYSHNWRLNWKKYLKCKFHFNIKEFVNTYACAVFWCQPIRAEKIGNRIIHCTSHGWFKWNCWNWTTLQDRDSRQPLTQHFWLYGWPFNTWMCRAATHLRFLVDHVIFLN